ncbi:MAG TPA: FimV/HubP family polar landmark protein [Casimicrobiaceae bacterium]|nr:FimV/HubP family polar landmark protein [Casimicrobiaceae bacterium]
MRAKPLITFGLVAGALAIAPSALALGLGRLTVDSALGQPLNARIELTSASRDELESLSAKIADPSLYRQNNLTYQGVLARTRVAVEYVGGNAVLKISSAAPVNEPFLDLMVELNWASGRVVREYTFLLDPPGVSAPAVAEPISPARTGAARTAAAPAPAAPRASMGQAAPTQSAGGDQYTVKPGDTLAKIAGQFKPNDVTLDQMLVAFFNSNQNAFDEQNINRLRRGAIMNVPSAADAAATESAEATRIVRMQAADWRSYRDRVAASAPAASGGASRETAGRIGTAVAETTPAAPPGRDQLKVSREANAKAGAAEERIARDKQLTEAQARIAALEKTVRDLQRSIEIKNESLAQVQSQADASKGKASETPSAVIAPPPPAAAAPTTEPAKANEPTKAGEPAKAPETKAAEAPKTEPKAAETKTPPAVPITPAKAPVKESPGFFSDLLANMPAWAIVAGALAVLAGIAAFVAGRRRKATKFEDSIISGTDIKTNTVFGSTGGGVVNTGENSLASDFSREGLGNIDTDEVDPIAEAEVYLAYGRDAQAEEILKEALKKDPQRQEIYLKLLEIHAQHNKPSAFETVASELFAVSQGQGETWTKAVALGRQLDPNNPMFSEGGASTHAAMESAPTHVDVTHELAVQKQEPPALDRMIDDDITIQPSTGMPKQRATDGTLAAPDHVPAVTARDKAAVDSTADAHNASADAATVALAGARAASKSTLESKVSALADKGATAKDVPHFDMDFQLDDADKPAPFRAKEAPTLTAAVAENTPTPSQLSRPAAALELDKLDLSFDPDRTTFEDPTPSVLDGQWHDAATKLDLAKAYQEMGDVEGAREILQEVLHEGDDQQKTEAQTLLGKLG